MRSLYFRRDVLSWALYDFANSAFATTVLAVVFNVYFVKVICKDGVRVFGRPLEGEAFWGAILSASMFVVFILSPILGAAADRAGSKKKFVLGFCALGCVFSSLLALCAEGDAWKAALFFLLANTGFSAGNALYNALIGEVSTPQTLGRVSGFGWAMGYLGGGLLLAINLAIVQKPQWFGIPETGHWPVRISLLSVGLWWAVFSLPFFLFVQEKKRGAAGENALLAGWSEVLQTFRELKSHRETLKFMAAFLVYNDGIETVIVMASIFGAKELGMSQSDLIVCFLMIQAVAFIGSLLFGALADRVGNKRAIQATLVIYLAVCAWGVVLRTTREFWMLGAVVGLVLGGSQSASRALLAALVPREKSGQFFGFFALTGKLAVVIGPFFFGLVAQLASLRAAVGSLAVFFAAGLGILYFVRDPHHERTAVNAA